VTIHGACAALVLAIGIGIGISGCASRPVQENHTFFQADELLARAIVETPYPALDLPAQAGAPAYKGVAVLGGSVRFSRPTSWQIRRTGSAAHRRFIEYVSPHEYVFAVYERDDDAGTSWSDALKLYETDTKRPDVEFLGKAIPIAGYDTQGREYVLRRKVRGQRAPYTNTSREFIFRGKHAFASVELVHQGQSDASIEGELLRTVETLSVL